MEAVSARVPNIVWKAAAVGGLIAGTIDITYAIVANAPKGFGPVVVLQSVASGLLGREAFRGGLATAAVGLVLHFVMVFAMALVFILAARNFAAVRKALLVSAVGYGAAIYFVMRWVVAPLSRFPGDLRTIHPLELLTHMVGVGLVIALVGRRLGAIANARSGGPS